MDDLWNKIESNTPRTDRMIAGEGDHLKKVQKALESGDPQDWNKHTKGNKLRSENKCPECGRYKKAEHDLCFNCHFPDECECGGRYDASEYDQCYNCSQL